MLDSGAGVISELYDAALEPGRWPIAVQSVVDIFGAAGGCYLVVDKSSGGVHAFSAAGPLQGLKADYIEHFARIDPYSAALRQAALGRWVRVSEIATDEMRRNDEWYNDFFLKSGCGDMVAARLFDDGRWAAIFGFHELRGGASVTPEKFDTLRPVLDALPKAAKLHHDLDSIGWKSIVALRALEQIATGIIVVDAAGHVIECNAAAQRILRRDDGISIRHGHLATRRVFETSRLAKMIAAASIRQGETSADHMLVVRSCAGAPYAITVTPLSAGLSIYEQGLTMVLIANPDELRPSQKTLADLFGFSPAECYLALALMRGHKLRDIAQDRGVRITTVRTQLSSVLKKAGAERQSDLVRILSGAQMA